jgi:hypothetical protein
MDGHELTDDECDPDLLRVGIRAPKLSQSQRKLNRSVLNRGSRSAPAPKFGRKFEGDPKARREASIDNYERRARQPSARGPMSRK